MAEPMRTIIASDDPEAGRRVCELLVRKGVECGADAVLSLDAAASRASRISPGLAVLLMSADRDRESKALRELVNASQSHVVVVGPADDPKLILRTLHDGADEYLDASRLEEELAATLARLKARQAPRPLDEEPGRVIAVFGPSGGSGASTLAVNVATVLARHHRTAALFDLRLAAGDLASMLDVQPAYTLADFCDSLDRVDRCMFEQFFAASGSGVHLLAAPREFSDGEKITSIGVRQAITLARGRFPYVVLDVDNIMDEEQIEVFWQADVILLVVRLDYTSIRNTRRAMERLVELGIGAGCIRLVANRHGQRKELRIRDAEAALGSKIAFSIPDAPAHVHGAVNAGMPVVLKRPMSKISRRMGAVAAGVNGHPAVRR
jgi:pilus assembly protein CpaE